MKRLKRILFVANGAKTEQNALARAAWLAQSFQAELLTVMVLGSQSFSLGRRSAWANADRLDQEAASGENHRLLVAESSVVQLKDSTRVEFETDRTLRQVINATSEYDVVIKSAGRVFFPLFQRWSDEDSKLLRHSSCPTWIIRNYEHNPESKILAVVDLTPVDSDAMARAVLKQAVAIAEKSNARLELATTWRVPRAQKLRSRISLSGLRREMKKGFRRQLKSLKEEFKFPKDATHLIQGDMRIAIPKLVSQQDFDLAVVGEQSDVMQHIAGNTAERLLAESKTSVLSISAIPEFANATVRDRSPKARRIIEPLRSCEKPGDDEGVLRC